MEAINGPLRRREPWTKGKLVGEKAPFKLKKRSGRFKFAFRSRPESRDLALFVKLRVTFADGIAVVHFVRTLKPSVHPPWTVMP